jgi:hypothetical protein
VKVFAASLVSFNRQRSIFSDANRQCYILSSIGQTDTIFTNRITLLPVLLLLLEAVPCREYRFDFARFSFTFSKVTPFSNLFFRIPRHAFCIHPLEHQHQQQLPHILVYCVVVEEDHYCTTTTLNHNMYFTKSLVVAAAFAISFVANTEAQRPNEFQVRRGHVSWCYCNCSVEVETAGWIDSILDSILL